MGMWTMIAVLGVAVAGGAVAGWLVLARPRSAQPMRHGGAAGQQVGRFVVSAQTALAKHGRHRGRTLIARPHLRRTA